MEISNFRITFSEGAPQKITFNNKKGHEKDQADWLWFRGPANAFEGNCRFC